MNISTQQRLRIAIVTETFTPEVNGVAMTLSRIVAGLLQRGHRVQLIRPRQAVDDDAQHDSAACEGLELVLAHGMPIPTYKDLRLGMPMKGRLCRLWRLQRPDVVHVATEGPLGWSAVHAAAKLRLPVTSSFHTNFHRYSQHYGIGLFTTLIDRYLCKLHNRTDATMVPTRAMMLELQQRGYQNVQLLSRGVATTLFTPQRRSLLLRECWGAAPEDVVVLFVSRLAREKNVDLVIASYKAIRQQQPRARLVFVGDGPLRVTLQTACPEAIFAGVRKGADLAAHYASGDLFLFPSLTETFGNVVPEALASGLAVLSYENAAAKELIINGHNGVLAAPGATAEFIQAAVALAADPERQKALRLAAPASVAHLSWEAVHGCFAEILCKAIALHQQPGARLSAALAPVSHSSA